MSLCLVAIAASAATRPAMADAYLTPFVGTAFGGQADDSRLTYGGSLTLAGEHGLLGVALDFGYTKDFLGRSQLGANNVATLMGNLVLLSPGRTRLYGSAGLGLLETHLQDLSGLAEIDSNELGVDVGGGVLLLAGEHVGLAGDLRYFRRLTDPEPDGRFDVGLGDLDFWRLAGGVTLRF